MATPSLAPTPSQVLRRRVEELRNKKGWSQQDLADRARDLGLPWDRTTVAKIEKVERGETLAKPRQVTVDELMTLAMVLGVSPVSLITPGDDSPVRVTDNTTTGGATVWRWATGTHPMGGRRVGEPVVAFGAEHEQLIQFYEEAKPVWFATAERRVPGLADMVRRVTAIAAALGGPADTVPSACEAILPALDDLEADLKDLRRRVQRIQKEATS